MRKAFAHDAVLLMVPDADIGGPGAAITAAVCGHWDHDGPCPFAPHYTFAEPVDDELRLRVLFAADPRSSRRSETRSNKLFKGLAERIETVIGPLGGCRQAVLGLSLRMKPHTAAV